MVQLISCSLSLVWLKGLRSYSLIRMFDGFPSSASERRCMPFSNSCVEAISMAFKRGRTKGKSLASPCKYSLPTARLSRLSFSLLRSMLSLMYSRMLVAIGSLGLPLGFPLYPLVNGINNGCLSNNLSMSHIGICTKNQIEVIYL